MANKHTRKEHISYRRKREAAVKEQNRKQLTKKQKVQLWSAIGAAALVVILFVTFAVPAIKGAVPSWFGNPMFAADDAILGKIGNFYYNLGTWNEELEGFTRDYNYVISRDPNRLDAYYTNNTEGAAVYSVYVGVVPEVTAEEMYDKVAAWVTEASELQDYADAPAPAKYFVTRSHFGEEQGTAQRSVVMYLETSENAVIHISINSNTVLEADLPAEEELLSVVPQVLANLTVK